MSLPYFQRAGSGITQHLLAFCLMSGVCLAQGTLADYQRAENLLERTRNKVFRSKVQPNWYGPDRSRFWYRNELPEQRHEFLSVDTKNGTRGPAFDHRQLAGMLSTRLSRDVDPSRLPLEKLEWSEDGESIRFNVGDKRFTYQLASDSLRDAESLKPADAKPAERNPRRSRSGPHSQESPDGAKVVFVRDHNLVLRFKSTGIETPLTVDGLPADSYETEVFWSPDSRKLVALRTRPAEKHTVHLIESSPQGQTEPKLHAIDYLKPGDRIAHPRVCVIDVPSSSEEVASASTPSNVPSALGDDLFPHPWSIEEIRWSADSSRFTFAYNQRGHQVLRILAVDAATRKVTALIDEQTPTFFDYTRKRFVEYADGSNEILWMSERDGWNHLYLYDSRSGQLKNQVTRGSWVVRSVERVDHERRQVFFRASGVFVDQDPYYVHYGRVNFDGSNLTWLTAGDGTHSIEFSPDRSCLIDTWSRVDQPPIIELRKTEDGSRICELERSDWSALLATGWKPPERFVSKGRDGTTDIFGVIWRPTHFESGRKYPVIEYIYAGPHDSFVPKAFSSYHAPQALAELGFVVVQIDGMGTSNRSKAFHDVCWKNLGDSGFPDRIAWIQAAARQYPQLDLTRVGIYGGSAGGQSSTRALLAHGDFYHVAVSDCGCHDNRMDKIWWNEQWMGYPIGDHYAQQSNVTNAHQLRGKLLLIVGELDRNVDPASTMQVANALIKADKDFDLIVIPGAGHGAAESAYGRRRRMDYFVRHLLGVEPRSNR